MLAERLSGGWQGAFTKVAALAVALMALSSIREGAELLGYVLPASDSQAVSTAQQTGLVVTGGSVGTVDVLETHGTTNAQRWLETAQGGGTVAAQQDERAGVQEVTINVEDAGYVPAHVRVRVGMPVRMHLVTNGVYSCVRAFVIPALNVERVLPASRSEVIEFTPTKTGEIPWSCSMGMFGGVMEVVE
jgi:heme/copper-type cytochrome/quinol oxidase subunit 2